MRIAIAGGTGVVGRHTAEALRADGHEVLVLARSTGTDLTKSTGLAERLRGVDAVIDVTSVVTQSARASKDFFGTATSHLLAAERDAGVRHHLVLSIVGAQKAPHGYYAGKALQEQLVTEGSTPWTILRATQFHEFAAQLYSRIAAGPLHLVPVMTSQPVAAREVGERLARLALGEPAGRARDLAGPARLRMADMVRGYARASGRGGAVLEVPLPGGFGRAMRDGTILPGPDADQGTETFAEWLRTVADPAGRAAPLA